jgi:hypothetical protein
VRLATDEIRERFGKKVSDVYAKCSFHGISSSDIATCWDGELKIFSR